LLVDNPGGGVVFDADGTLWSTDVGCTVFDYACARGLFREDSEEGLRKEAERQGISIRGPSGPNETARILQGAFRAGNYEERACAEMQVWAYAGYSEQEFRVLIREALEEGQYRRTLHADVLRIAEWSWKMGAQVNIVSASPRWVVEEAVSEFEFFSASRIAAGDPNLEERGDVVYMRHGLAAPLPYGRDKVKGGRALLQGRPWLATFGDSDFDLDMMAEAALAVGIGDKTTMLTGLSQLPNGVRLLL
jgi:phosphoserine phosphatase